METIYIGDNINNETITNYYINLGFDYHVKPHLLCLSFYPGGKKIVKITGSSIIGHADLKVIGKSDDAKEYPIEFETRFIDISAINSGYAILNDLYINRPAKSIEELKSFELGKVFPTLEECFAYLLPTAEIVIDPFTKNKNLIWSNDFVYHTTNNSMFPSIKTMNPRLWEQAAATLSISFEYIEGHGCIRFSTKKDHKIQQGDCISLLFTNGCVIDFPIQNKVVQEMDDCYSYCTLYRDDMELFINECVCQYRITYNKSNKAPLVGDFVNEIYSPYDNELFAAYATHYLEELTQLVPEYKLPCRKVNSSISGYSFNWCYVYLMRDNTNGYHKIGISNNPEYRERTLQSEKPTIEMLACKKFPTRKIAEAIESALHTAYSQQRLRGEWFKLDDVDVATIIETLK
jgi:hypothetical protein